MWINNFVRQEPKMFRLLMVRCFALIAGCSFSVAAFAQPFDAAPDELSVMTWNVEWMYDDYIGDNRGKLAREQSAPSEDYWSAKVDSVAAVLASESPHIVALQEIESVGTLREISRKLKQLGHSYRWAFIEGTDTFTEQDVGLLVRNGLVSYQRYEQSKSMFDSHKYYNLSKHLGAKFRWSTVESPLTLLNVHLRATEKAADKRLRQARLGRLWLQAPLAAGEDVIFLGDMNSEYSAGEMKFDVAAIAQAKGGPPMVDLLTRLDDPTEPTHLILDKQFDRIYVSESMVADGPGKDWVFDSIRVIVKPVIRGRRDGPEHWDRRLSENFGDLDVSDHFPVVATFKLK